MHFRVKELVLKVSPDDTPKDPEEWTGLLECGPPPPPTGGGATTTDPKAAPPQISLLREQLRQALL
jgi:hypothetical protein